MEEIEEEIKATTMTENVLKLCEIVSDDGRTKDVLALYVKPITTVADYFIIGTARNNSHIHALTEDVLMAAKELSLEFFHIEGSKNASWVLIDLGDILVHLFLESAREFYQLEKLWMDAASLPLDHLNNK